MWKSAIVTDATRVILERILVVSGDAPIAAVGAVIMEPAFFRDFKDFEAAYRKATVRILVVARDAEGESRALAVLRNEDDLVRLDVLDGQLRLRLDRLRSDLLRLRNDPLTGLSNRGVLFELAAAVIAEGVDEDFPLSAIIVDLDHFKVINNQHGHLSGDEVLRRISRVLEEGATDALCVARYGGEELCAILPETGIGEAGTIAARILAEIRGIEAVAVDGRRFRITASAGIVEISVDDLGIPEFVQRAGKKVREAKKAGKDRAAS